MWVKPWKSPKCKLKLSELWVGAVASRLLPTGYLLTLVLSDKNNISKVQEIESGETCISVSPNPRLLSASQFNCVIVVPFFSTSSRTFVTLVISHSEIFFSFIFRISLSHTWTLKALLIRRHLTCWGNSFLQETGGCKSSPSLSLTTNVFSKNT